jgi:hypothetical protein
MTTYSEKSEYFWRLRCAVPCVLSIDEDLKGLRQVSLLAQKYREQFEQLSAGFWNTPRRESVESDAVYISLVLCTLKKYCGVEGGKCAADLIDKLEKYNAD